MNIEFWKEKYGSSSYQETARLLAEGGGLGPVFAIFAYKNEPDGPYTDFEPCYSQEELDHKMNSRGCIQAKIVYRRSSPAP